MTNAIGWACSAMLLALTVLVAYQWLLAAASAWPARPRPRRERASSTRFVVLVPAHNEEDGLAPTLQSLASVAYPKAAFRVVVIADRCDDQTAAVARALGADCLERDGGAPGKGPAIAWALDRLRDARVDFDAVVIVDADTVADRGLLAAFDAKLEEGSDVQQGYNYLSNPWDSPFTRIISVTSVLRNQLFYGGKERLGLPAMLTGTGMCLSRRILESRGWTAFSVGEDWEFSASLLLDGERVHFNRDARVMARESQGFRQASSQRLRWASGRHAVAAASVKSLMATAVRLGRPGLFDAALTIAAPTYSVQAASAAACLLVGWLVSGDAAWRLLSVWDALVTAALALYFFVGAMLTESPFKSLGGVVLIPVFLPWRVAIEILGLLGFGRKRWVRTSRLSPSR